MQKETIKKDKSFGVIPVYKKGNDWLFLLIHQKRGDLWGFPKGHPDQNESEVSAAIRELEEETGISKVDIREDLYFSSRYSFVDDYSFPGREIRINKTVKYFLGFIKDMESEFIENKEIKNYAWLGYKKALDKITFQGTKDVLTKVYNFLKSTNDN